MATVHKYAGLPDVDDNAQEIYESTLPDLTEASTLPTQSEISDDGDENLNFDRRTLNPDAARRRFEPSLVDARNANFSDTVAGQRAAYQTGRRRRRRRQNRGRGSDHSLGEYSDLSDEETLQARLARLRREVEEVKTEIEQLERHGDGRMLDAEKITGEDDDQSTYEDAVDENSPGIQKLGAEREELDELLRGLSSATSRMKGQTKEEAFLSTLSAPSTIPTKSPAIAQHQSLSPSTISAIAAFSDRLTTLESLLGLSASNVTISPPVLPTLSYLTTQIETLASTLSPRSEPSATTTGTTVLDSTIHLQPLFQKVRDLNDEAKVLTAANKAASRSFEELLESRERHGHLLEDVENRYGRNTGGGERERGRDGEGKGGTQAQFVPVFLESQSSRITALHALLPTITQLQPLLPVILERLRTLSRIHTGAAEARAELDEAERRLDMLEKDVGTWSKALEDAEKAMAEGKVIMQDNVQTIGRMVKEVEERCQQLENE